jgi:hypothetical protein
MIRWVESQPHHIQYNSHAIHTQVVIDNAGYICYVEARFLGHQNDTKQFTMMQQIGVNGRLHFLEDCILLVDQIYSNRHPTVTLFTTQQITPICCIIVNCFVSF